MRLVDTGYENKGPGHTALDTAAEDEPVGGIHLHTLAVADAVVHMPNGSLELCAHPTVSGLS